MHMMMEDRIKRSHVQLMKHPETALYSGIMMMGESSVTDDAITAYTDGVNKRYGRQFMEPLAEPEVNAIVLHENLHVALRHLTHGRDMFIEDQETANKAADYVVNGIIATLKDRALCRLPEGALVDVKYFNMSMREVYRLLRKKKQEGGGKSEGEGEGEGKSGGGGYQFDQHDPNGTGQPGQAPTPEELKQIDEKIDRALREGALLAGRMGAKIPRAITEALEVKTRWQDELREFVTSTMKGRDEYTWRRFHRRALANDMYLPSVENETIGEVVVAIDTSGSIGARELNEFGSELASLCNAVSPDRVRVLWWDTMVHGEQIFSGGYDGIMKMLKPLGGGGTHVGCVSEHIIKNKIKAECVIVFTDGYVEPSPVWDTPLPTLWLVTQNKNFRPSAGRKVVYEA